MNFGHHHCSQAQSPVAVPELVKPQMQTPEPTLKSFQRAAPILVSLAALLTLVLSGTSCSKRSPVSPLLFGHLAVPTSTNANLLWVAVTNQSDSVVVCLACPPQVRANGTWSGSPLPPRQKMTKLSAGQSGVIVVAATSVNENVRVPVLWGFSDYTPGATRWQQFREDLVARLNGRAGVGLLYTNYLTDLKP
jgi:hypothetical protein